MLKHKYFCYNEIVEGVGNHGEEEVPPAFAMKEDLEFFLSGENLEAVIGSALYQKSEPSTEDFVDAINYFLSNDSFIQF